MKKYNVILNTFAYVIGAFFVQGLRFLTLPFFSRLMSTSEYALMSSFEAWVSIITIFVGAQAHASINNAYMDFGGNKIKSYVSNIASVGIVTAAGTALVTLLGGGLFVNAFELDLNYLLLGIVQSLFAYYLSLLITEYRILGKAAGYLVFSIINSVISVGVGMILVWIMPENRYVGRIYASLIAAVLVGGTACMLIYRQGKSFYNKQHIKYALHLSLPLIFHSLGGIILGKADQLMLLKLMSRPEMGIYSYGTNFAHIIYVFGNACNMAYCPMYYSLRQENNRQRIIKVNTVYIKVYMLGVSAVILLLPEIIRIMSGAEYYGAIYTAPLLAGSFMLNFLYTFPVNYEFFCKKTKYIAYATAVSAVINVILNYLLIPVLGGMGAATATLISTLFQFGVHYFVARKIIGDYEMPLRYFIYAMAGIAVLMLLYYLMVELWLVRIPVAAVLVVLCLWCLWKNKDIMK